MICIIYKTTLLEYISLCKVYKVDAILSSILKYKNTEAYKS